jgi:hypothetical protein
VSSLPDSLPMDDVIEVTPHERLRHLRAITSIPGRYMLANRRNASGERYEFDCWIVNISLLEMVLTAPIIGEIGERVIVYSGMFGKLHGPILRLMPNGFVISIVASKSQREKLRTKLAWLAAKDHYYRRRDNRRHFRIIPQEPIATLTLEDGSSTLCLILDVSVSGAAVSTDTSLSVGAEVSIGQMKGRVVRSFPGGFAVEFSGSWRGGSDISLRIIRPTGYLQSTGRRHLENPYHRPRIANPGRPRPISEIMPLGAKCVVKAHEIRQM